MEAKDTSVKVESTKPYAVKMRSKFGYEWTWYSPDVRDDGAAMRLAEFHNQGAKAISAEGIW